MTTTRLQRDLGLETVAYVRARYQVEDKWHETRERGFRWWPAEQAQEIWAEPAWDDDGRVRLAADTDHPILGKGLLALLKLPIPGVGWARGSATALEGA